MSMSVGMITKLMKMTISGEKYVAIICSKIDASNVNLLRVYRSGSYMLIAYVGVSSVSEANRIKMKNKMRFLRA